MRLIEVVMLMGAHCVSPVEHSQTMTDAAKVQCAVVIEKDTDKGTLKVTPPEAALDPQVVAVVTRLGADGTRIVPARAPAGSPTVEIKPAPLAAVAVPPPVAPPADMAAPAATPAQGTAAAQAAPAAPPAVAPEPPQRVASIATPAPKRSAARAAAAAPKKAKPAAARKAVQCKGNAVAKWYRTTDGHRRFRCVSTRAGAPADQIY